VAEVRIGADFYDAVERYVEGLMETAQQAAVEASGYLYSAVVDRARQDPNWVGLADNIGLWSEDGHLVIGITDTALISQAHAIEYGDEVRPPSPLFRTLSGEVQAAGQAGQDVFRSTYPASQWR
jgi:hypothetical protein